MTPRVPRTAELSALLALVPTPVSVPRGERRWLLQRPALVAAAETAPQRVHQRAAVGGPVGGPVGGAVGGDRACWLRWLRLLQAEGSSNISRQLSPPPPPLAPSGEPPSLPPPSPAPPPTPPPLRRPSSRAADRAVQSGQPVPCPRLALPQPRGRRAAREAPTTPEGAAEARRSSRTEQQKTRQLDEMAEARSCLPWQP